MNLLFLCGLLTARAARAVWASTHLLVSLSSSLSGLVLLLEGGNPLVVLLGKLLSVPGLGQPVRDGTNQL